MSHAAIASLPSAPDENFLGHAHVLRGDRTGYLSRLGLAGPLVRMRFFTRWLLFANHPEVIHEVLVTKASSFEKSPGIRLLLHDLAGQGLFTSDGELWRRQRRMMSPLFHPSQLATYTQSMNSEARRAVDRFADGQPIDLLKESTRIAMGVVGATLFGADTWNQVDALGEALTELLGWVNDNSENSSLVVQIALLEGVEKLGRHTPKALEPLRKRLLDTLNQPVLLAGRNKPEIRHALRTLDGYMAQMIEERRAQLTPRKDLLTRLLLARDSDAKGASSGMDDKQVRDEANTLFVAGHETTATAIAWCFYLLARHPEARARVQAEADAFGPEGPSQPEPQRLAYTTRVFKEALRLYPPVIILARRTTEDVTIGGVHLPAGKIVMVSPLSVHNLPSVWPNPAAFDPDRFLPEREQARHKAAWLPFGEGPRVCIGNYFALLEGPIVLATLMRRARFDIDENRLIRPDSFATLRPAGGVPATVHLR